MQHQDISAVHDGVTGKRMKSATKDVFRFSVAENNQHAFYVSTVDLSAIGYLVVPISDCAVKLLYKSVEVFITCAPQSQQAQMQQSLTLLNF